MNNDIDFVFHIVASKDRVFSLQPRELELHILNEMSRLKEISNQVLRIKFCASSMPSMQTRVCFSNDIFRAFVPDRLCLFAVLLVESTSTYC